VAPLQLFIYTFGGGETYFYGAEKVCDGFHNCEREVRLFLAVEKSVFAIPGGRAEMEPCEIGKWAEIALLLFGMMFRDLISAAGKPQCSSGAEYFYTFVGVRGCKLWCRIKVG